MRRYSPILFAVLGLHAALLAQSSSSFKLEEQQFNAGGHPAAGITIASSSFRLSLDSIGEPVSGRSLASAAYAVDGSFVAAHPPPGEVDTIAFSDSDTLTWNPDASSVRFNLYRDLTDTLPGSYGDCEQPGLMTPSADDVDDPGLGQSFIYLVTMVNRLDEEGTKGFDSGGVERGGATCP